MSPGTLISGTPVEQIGSPWSFPAYYRSILICSVLCQFFLRERTRHEFILRVLYFMIF